MAFMDETGLAELWSLVRNADVKIATGSYTGTGKYGSSYPCTLTFGFAPKIVFVGWSHTDSVSVPMVFLNGGNQTQFYTVSFPYDSYNTSVAYRFSDNTLTWYSSSVAQQQNNLSGTTYFYLAIG